MVKTPIGVVDARDYLRVIEARAGALAIALEHMARTAPEPDRAYMITWAATAENIADQAHAAEAGLNP